MDTSLAKRILGLIDLTSLGDDDTEATVRDLAARAVSTHGSVAALCIWPRFIGTARDALGDHVLPIATVTNFPAGAADVRLAARETEQAVRAGANEIDVVFPYRAFLAGDRVTGAELVRECRAACGSEVLLKVILETGQLVDSASIRAAAEIAVEAGAQFLKTSTGKTQPGATPEAARVLIEVIAASPHDRVIGFKASGGVKTLDAAKGYLAQFDAAMGADAAAHDNFRIGASSLLNDIVRLLEREP